MNLQTLTDEELAEHAVAVRTERERRQNLTQTPETIARLASRYLADGGDSETLTAAITQ